MHRTVRMTGGARRRQPAPQRGSTLIVTLISLVVIMMVGVSVVRTATVDEKMAGNFRDRDRAFQAAEAAVSQCLDALQKGSFTGPKLTPTGVGTTPVWEVAGNWDAAHSTALTVDGSLAEQARCMVETLGGDDYRVTGRGIGGNAAAPTEVILQATLSSGG